MPVLRLNMEPVCEVDGEYESYRLHVPERVSCIAFNPDPPSCGVMETLQFHRDIFGYSCKDDNFYVSEGMIKKKDKMDMIFRLGL